jgi:hypothetical protein
MASVSLRVRIKPTTQRPSNLQLKIHILTLNVFYLRNIKIVKKHKSIIKRVCFGIAVNVKFASKRPLGLPRRRWVDSFKMDLRETEWGGIGWIDLVQNEDQFLLTW